MPWQIRDSASACMVELAKTQVTDETLPAVLAIHADQVELEDTGVSDIGLEEIARCNVRNLRLEGSRAIKQGARDLQNRLGVFVLNVGPPDPSKLEVDRLMGDVDRVRKSIPTPVMPGAGDDR